MLCSCFPLMDIPSSLTTFRLHALKECQRQVEPPELLMTACSKNCKNGHCTPTGKCCCSPGWEGPFCRVGECLLLDFLPLLSKLYHLDKHPRAGSSQMSKWGVCYKCSYKSSKPIWCFALVLTSYGFISSLFWCSQMWTSLPQWRSVLGAQQVPV